MTDFCLRCGHEIPADDFRWSIEGRSPVCEPCKIADDETASGDDEAPPCRKTREVPA